MSKPRIISERPRTDWRAKTADEWFQILTGIKPADLKGKKKGRLFGPRSEEFPV